MKFKVGSTINTMEVLELLNQGDADSGRALLCCTVCKKKAEFSVASLRAYDKKGSGLCPSCHARPVKRYVVGDTWKNLRYNGRTWECLDCGEDTSQKKAGLSARIRKHGFACYGCETPLEPDPLAPRSKIDRETSKVEATCFDPRSAKKAPDYVKSLKTGSGIQIKNRFFPEKVLKDCLERLCVPKDYPIDYSELKLRMKEGAIHLNEKVVYLYVTEELKLPLKTDLFESKC